jgi:hypothetical protein
LTRAPEAKMMLIAPVILVFVFGSLVLSRTFTPPELVRPFMAAAASAMVLLTSVQLTGNQFGYDRTGFRAYVLSPIPRSDVLLGKNLAVAPLALGLSLIIVVVVQVLSPMRLDHLLAVLVQLASMFLIFCLLANALAILAPIPIAAGAFQPSRVRMTPILFHMAFMLIFPMALLPIFAPLGLEALLSELGHARGWPIALVLSLGLLAGIVALYRRAVVWEGRWLAGREQAILEVVTSREE